MEKNKQNLMLKRFLFVLGIVSILLGLFADYFLRRPPFLGYSQIAIIICGCLILLLSLRFDEIILILTHDTIIHRIIDILIVFLFLSYSTLFFIGKWDGLSPTPEFSSDAAAITGYAVAYDFPDNFYNDLLLGNVNHAIHYRLLIIPLISVLTRFTGDYSLSFLIFLPISMFLHLFGYYLLGKKILGHQFSAFLFSLLSAVTIPYGAGDYWGFFRDPQPRFIFQSLLPYLLLFCLDSAEKPKRWPLIIFVTGLAGYIHLLSGSAIAFLVWLTFFVWRPHNFSIWKTAFFQVLLGMVYLVTTIPIFLIYGRTSAEYFVDVPNIVKWYFLNQSYFFIFLLLAILLFVFLLIKKNLDVTLKTLLFWLAGCYFISIIIPMCQFLLWNNSGIKILPLDLVRNLRYSFPIIFLLILYCFEKILVYFPPLFRRPIIPNILILLFVFIIATPIFSSFKTSPYYFKDQAFDALTCFQARQWFCPLQSQKNSQEVLLFIREELPYDAEILSAPKNRLAEQIRYGGERTSSFVVADSARLISDEAANQNKNKLAFDRISKETNSFQLAEILIFACNLKSDYILFDTKYPSEVFESAQALEVVYSNDNFDLAKIISCSP